MAKKNNAALELEQREQVKNPFNLIVIVAALGYFVDIYDLLLFRKRLYFPANNFQEFYFAYLSHQIIFPWFPGSFNSGVFFKDLRLKKLIFVIYPVIMILAY